MEFTFVSILLILFVVGGATKAAAFFAAAAGGMSLADRRSTVFRAVAVQAVVMYAFAFFGQDILHFFHVSLGGLEIAGGLDRSSCERLPPGACGTSRTAIDASPRSPSTRASISEGDPSALASAAMLATWPSTAAQLMDCRKVSALPVSTT